MKKILVITASIVLLAAACNKQAAVQPAPIQPPISVPAPIKPSPVQPTPSPVQPTPVPPASQPSPMVFDVTKAKVGDKIGNMTITSIKGKNNVNTAVVNFKGQVNITGTYYPQVSDLSSGCAQFRDLDTASLAKMPRISGDNRETRFCFGSPDSAKQKLGSATKPATITIDNYIIDNRPDTSNAADLISVQ